MTPAKVGELLERLAGDLRELTESWVIFGSAALAIRGLPEPEIPDVDILTTEAGAAALEATWSEWRDVAHAPAPDAPFRSRFSRYAFPEGAVEVMGGLEHRAEGRWAPVKVATAEEAVFYGRAWPIPTVGEQVRILRLFARPKDLARAERLERWLATG